MSLTCVAATSGFFHEHAPDVAPAELAVNLVAPVRLCRAALLLTGDVTREPVRYADGAILALDGPGLGVEVDEQRLKEWIGH